MAEGGYNEELSEFVNKLWELDENKCEPWVDYELDLQGYVTSTRNMSRDWANEHLFAWLDEDKVFAKPTYSAFRALLDNYESETGIQEVVTAEEQGETEHFIDIICETPVMQEVHQYLVNQNRAPEDLEAFKNLLWKIWFKLYRRTRGDRDFDSSGFEHVFVGETRGRDVTGFHNWLQFYLQEKRGHIDYRGYFRRGTADEENPRIITLQFIWRKENAEKPIGSSFVGTSPEFEIALYTLLHRMGHEKSLLNLNDFYDVEMTCYRLGRGIGSAFPVSKCD